MRVWSTISTPLLFLAAAWLLIDRRLDMIVGLAGFMLGFPAIEAIARKRLTAYVVTRWCSWWCSWWQ